MIHSSNSAPSIHKPNHSPASPSLRVLLYDIILKQTSRSIVERRRLESHQLVKTYHGIVLADIIQRRHHYGTWGFIGYHKLQELIELAYDQKANLILINQALKPRQIHNLERALETYSYEQKRPRTIKIWDRVDLIINIFSKHAQSAEARLQLELARIEHFGPRIYGMGEDLSQQGGGIGTRGLGETNTEIMKRHLAQRKKIIKKKITNFAKTREAHRLRRSKNGLKTIALIGYTNTGKSALFKKLTGKNTYIKDELFATLQTLTARIFIEDPSTPPLIISDTIGFIEDLPPKLLDAFRATLEDTLASAMLLHIIDISDHAFPRKIKIVNQILKEINAHTIPTLMIFNKLDKLNPNDPLSSHEAQKLFSDKNSLFVSAKTGHNINLLKNTIAAFFTSKPLSSSPIENTAYARTQITPDQPPTVKEISIPSLHSQSKTLVTDRPANKKTPPKESTLTEPTHMPITVKTSS